MKLLQITALVVACVAVSVLPSLSQGDGKSDPNYPYFTKENQKNYKNFKGTVGETETPPENYSVQDPNNVAPYDDYEPPHVQRVKEPYKSIIPKLDPTVPTNVRPHSRDVLSDIEDRPFFDYNGWQTFIGLIWPAKKGERGVPDPQVTKDNFANYNNGKGDSTPTVFETLLSFEDALPGGDTEPAKPADWFATQYARPFDLTKMSKADQLNEAFSTPLIDQNRQYVRYSLQLNRVFYEFLRENRYDLKGNLPKSPSPVPLPPLDVPADPVFDKNGYLTVTLQPQTNTVLKQPVNGNIITIKTAWRILLTDKDLDPKKPWRKADQLDRYFTSQAKVVDAVTSKVETKTVGLIGLHVVVRTTQFPQGLWSSFSHIDNLEPPKGIRPSFNGTGRFYPSGFSYQPQGISDDTPGLPEDQRQPVEVSRIYKIPDTPVAKPANLPYGASTQGLNKLYQETILKGTVWANYQLEITNWPTNPGSFFAKPFYYQRGIGNKPDPSQPLAVQQIYERAEANAKAAYPQLSGLPIPQVGALNPVLETYFQNPPGAQPLENTSCIGCHYGASDLGYVWSYRLGVWPQPFDQGRLNPKDGELASEPANTE